MRALRHSLAALAAIVGAPIMACALLLRPAWRIGIGERLGRLPRPSPNSIWIHAASVGEIRAASRLADRLRSSGHAVFTSSVTLTGREMMRQTRPDVPCHLAPLDHPWCVAAALDRVRPAALILVETELWPCWIAAAARRGIPVVVVSGRVSDRSFPRYRRLDRVVRRTLGRLAAVGARSDVDSGRFRTLGAAADRVCVTGDLKLERDEKPPQLAPDLARVLEHVPLFVAGSTHAGEESAALAALDEVERAGLQAAMILAPRHPRRSPEVERLVLDCGRPLRRRSALGDRPLVAGEVLVLDTIGELAPAYTRADVAFVGGTLIQRGGHNILEPIFAGCPVLFGRYTANIRDAVEIVERSLAGCRVEDAEALGPAVVEWLRDPGAARALGARGCAALRHHRGSSERSAELIEAVLSRRSAPAD